MIHLDAATVLLQWAVGGLAFLWFTTRRHEIGLGYAMLLRITYGVFAAGACGFGLRYGVEPVREVSAVAVAVAAFVLIRNKRSRFDLIAPLLGIPGIIVAGFAAAGGAGIAVGADSGQGTAADARATARLFGAAQYRCAAHAAQTRASL